MLDSRRKKIAIILIAISVALLIMNLVILDYSNFDYKHLFGPLSNVLLILAMYLSIIDINKKANSEKC